MVPLPEAKRLLEQAQARRREVAQILDQLRKRATLTSAQKSVMLTIGNFVKLSEDAEKNDPRQADSFAERAQILAKELQSEQ